MFTIILILVVMSLMFGLLYIGTQQEKKDKLAELSKN